MPLFVARYWKEIVAGVVVAVLLVALVATRSTLSERTEALTKANQAIGAERASHGVTKAGLETCLITNQQMSDASDARAAEYAKAKASATGTEREMDRKQAADAGRGQYLSGVASGTGNGCAVPGAVLDKLKGL